MILAVSACVKRGLVSAPSLPPPPAPGAVALEEGDRAFSANDYENACVAYEAYLRLTPAQQHQDQALFRLGLAYAIRKTNPDWQRAAETWKRLLTDYSGSPYKPQVELILALYSEVGQVSADVKSRDDRIRQLSTELDRLKRIDADRRKTP
jgi:outer membrane protein assembly factor BamD (BamD/ComL family)